MTKQINLLGTLSIIENGRTSPLAKNAKGCALLTYLIISNQPQKRETIADLLWDAASTKQSLRNLRVLLTRIRPYLPELNITRSTLSLIPNHDLDVDYLALESALQSKESAQLDYALSLYKGELLAGFYLEDAVQFNEWLLLTRERVRQRIRTAFDELSVKYAEQQAWSHGVDLARRWLAIDDLDESAYRWLMRHLAGQGQLSQALQQYGICGQRLEQELGVEPEPATTSLAQKLLEQMSSQPTQLNIKTVAQLVRPQPNELAELGPLPPNTILPFHRNQDFTGRQPTLIQIAAKLLPDEKTQKIPQVLAITGMGGLGKTQLAVEFCFRYGRYFSGGVYWMNFADAENVPEEIALTGAARGMGLYHEADQLTLTDKVGRVQKAWQEPVPRLLIFDNCEDENDLTNWLPQAGGCRVLLTSRRGHWSRELHITAVSLPLFREQESVTLLQSLVPNLSEADAIQIGAEVGHLPLALHLTGGFLRRYQQISPTQYLSHLRQQGLLQHPSLQGRGTAYSPTGHELDVKRTFALSIEQLNEEDEVDMMAQQILIHAAMFAPAEPIPQDLLQATIIQDETDFLTSLLVEDSLTRLITLGFLKAEGREAVILHRLLAAYTLEEVASEQAKQTAQTAVVATVLQCLMQTKDTQGHLSILPFSVVHLRHIAIQALANKTTRSANVATLLSIHLINMGEFKEEAENYLHEACRIAEEIGDHMTAAQSFSSLSRAYEHQGRDEDALHSAQLAVAYFKKANTADSSRLAEALYRQGWAHFRLSQAQEALAVAEEGIAYGEASGDKEGIGRNLSLLGVVHYYLLGNYDLAAQHLQAGLEIYEELAYSNGQASLLNNMGENARLQGDYAAAASYYEKALNIAREINNRSYEMIFLSNWCGTQLYLGHTETAVSKLEKLTAQAPSGWFGLSEAHRFLAEAYWQQGDKPQLALSAAQLAFVLAQPTNVAEYGRAWRVLGLTIAQLGRPAQANPDDETLYGAKACFQQSLDYFEISNLDRDRAITLQHWAEYELEQGNLTQGNALWQKAEAIFTQLNLPLMVQRMKASGNVS